MTDMLKHEWKGIALLAAVLVGAGFFVSTLVAPPWSERVLKAIAEQPQTVRPQMTHHVARN